MRSFVPETYHKYLYLNYQMSGTYRRYNDFIPDYLRERLGQVIIHCLERKSSSKNYTEDSILTKDATTRKFTIQGSGREHTIEFGVCTRAVTILYFAISIYCTQRIAIYWHIAIQHIVSWRVRNVWKRSLLSLQLYIITYSKQTSGAT